MKKSLIIFLFIFLLVSISFVSAGGFNNFFTGKVIGTPSSQQIILKERVKIQINSSNETFIISKPNVDSSGRVKIIVEDELGNTEVISSDEQGVLEVGGEKFSVETAKSK